MPCRNGCSRPAPGPLCCCTGRCSRHRPQGEFCTADTCSNPEFCITYRPQFCPNASPGQENPASKSSQHENWPPPPPFPDIPAPPWPTLNSHHHPLSSTQNPRHSRHSFSSLQSLPTRQPCCQNLPQSTQSPRKSTARLSIGKPSFARLDSGQNPFDCLISPGSRSAMRLRLATIGRPSLTRLDFGCCQTDRYNQDESNFGGVGIRYGELSRNADSCRPGSFQQAPEPSHNDFGTDSPKQDARCECRMPPAFARFRCTGNLGGLCDCPKCDDNE